MNKLFFWWILHSTSMEFQIIFLLFTFSITSLGMSFMSCVSGGAPGAKLVWWFWIGSSAWLCRNMLRGTYCLLATVNCSLRCVPSAAVRLRSCSTLNLFLDLLTLNLNVIVALKCSLRLCLENNEFTRDLILKVQAGHKPYLLCSRIMDTGTVSSLNPGKKAPGSKPDFVDIFNYVLLVKQ